MLIRYFPRQHMPIRGVVYHYVRPANNSTLKYLSINDFKNQIDYFQSNFGSIITKNQWEDAKKGHDINGVLLTFDDGFKDHHRYVLPLLKAQNLFGIFFICSDPLIKKIGLQVHLVHYLLTLGHNEQIFKFIEQRIPRTILEEIHKEPAINAYKNRNDQKEEIVLKKLINYCRSSNNLVEVFNEVWSTFSNIHLDEFLNEWYMSNTEVIDLLNNGMDVGSHTCSHKLLSLQSKSEILTELSESKSSLENLTGSSISEFCYPFGGKLSYNEEVIGCVEKVGYRFAHDVAPRVMSRNDFKSRLTLPRFDCNLFPFGESFIFKSN